MAAVTEMGANMKGKNGTYVVARAVRHGDLYTRGWTNATANGALAHEAEGGTAGWGTGGIAVVGPFDVSSVNTSRSSSRIGKGIAAPKHKYQ